MKMMKLVTPIVILMLLTACGGGVSEQAAVDTQVAALINQQATADAAAGASQPTATTAAVATIAPVNTSGGQIQIPQDAAICLPIGTDQVVGRVTDVWGGDSIQVNVNGQSIEVRYIGIDAGDLPFEANVAMVDGKEVLLIKDVTDVDEYGRYPRYVISADGLFVNLEMIRRGGAFPSPEEPDLACKDVFEAAGPQ
jgi:endonuclease YncB( thermonuclease family)